MSGRHVLTARQFNELTALHDYKWVRLTNKDECHHGFQYKTGLNENTKPFKAETDFEDGLYFCLQEDAYHWAHVTQHHIRSVVIPESESANDNTDLIVVDFDKHKAKAHKFELGERKRTVDRQFLPDCSYRVTQIGIINDSS